MWISLSWKVEWANVHDYFNEKKQCATEDQWAENHHWGLQQSSWWWSGKVIIHYLQTALGGRQLAGSPWNNPSPIGSPKCRLFGENVCPVHTVGKTVSNSHQILPLIQMLVEKAVWLAGLGSLGVFLPRWSRWPDESCAHSLAKPRMALGMPSSLSLHNLSVSWVVPSFTVLFPRLFYSPLSANLGLGPVYLPDRTSAWWSHPHPGFEIHL